MQSIFCATTIIDNIYITFAPHSFALNSQPFFSRFESSEVCYTVTFNVDVRGMKKTFGFFSLKI